VVGGQRAGGDLREWGVAERIWWMGERGKLAGDKIACFTAQHNTRGQKAKKRRFLRNGMGCYVRQLTEDAKKDSAKGP